MTMNSNNNGRITAAEPEFRAAVMVARRDSAPLLLSASSQQRGDYYASLAHSNSFPPYEEESMDDAVCGRPSMMLIRNNDLILNTCGVLNTATTTTTTTTTTQNSKNNDTMALATTTPWRLYPELRPVGQYHLVSKNSAYVHKHELPAVLERLQATFQAASCKCDSSGNRVKCVTLEETEFVVSFWLKNGSVLIEVDRVAGDSVVFHSCYAPLVIQAVHGTSTIPICPASAAPTGIGAMEMQYLHDKLFRMSATTLPPGFFDVMNHVEDALDLVGSMLASDRYDVTCLGLESLAIMTDPAKSSPGVAVAVSRVILTGSASTGEAIISRRNSKIRQYVYCLALTGRFWRTNVDTEMNEADAKDSDMTAQHAYKSLSILANAVTMASTEDLICFIHEAEQLPGVHSVVDRLLALVREAQQSPHFAFLATHILAALVDAHSVESEGINVDTIQEAQFVGTCSHAALAQASHRLLTNLAAAAAS